MSIKKVWGDMIEEMEWPDSTPMTDFYRDKTIFITGATGGIGQLIVQKLLRWVIIIVIQ